MTHTLPFEHLLAAYAVRAHAAALGFLGDEQEAREVAQEALLRAFRARDRYDRTRPFYPWLRRIVRNICVDRVRRRRVVPGLEAERVPDPGIGPEAALDLERGIASMRAALEMLSPPHREIIVLRHFEELSYAEIAQVLGVAEGTVMSRLYRARKALAAAMRTPQRRRKG